MATNEDIGSPGWGASYFMQTTEDVARAVAAAAATVRSPRPSVVFSSKEENSNSQLQKLQRQVARVLKGFSPPPEVKKGAYNPEVLTSQKRQWARFQLQSLDQKCVKEPSRLFESMVVVGLHPNSDVQALQKMVFEKDNEGSRKLRSGQHCQNQPHIEPKVEPQVLFVYPPEKQLPLKYKDLLSFCFPGDLEVRAVERTPSMSELNEILLGQEHLKQSDLSFVFRLQVADDSTLYGCCVLVEEIVQKPSRLISMITDEYPRCTSLGRYIITTPRCYCILSRFPFFDLHFGILKSILSEERLERLTKGIGALDLVSPNDDIEEEIFEKSDKILARDNSVQDLPTGSVESSDSNKEVSAPRRNTDNERNSEHQILNGDVGRKGIHGNMILLANSEHERFTTEMECGVSLQASNCLEFSADEITRNKDAVEKRLPGSVLPLLRHHQYESSDSSTSVQGSPSEERNFRSDMKEAEMEEASSSGQDESNDHNDILEWAKANNHGSLQIICEYYRLRCLERGSSLTFLPLEHLYPLEFHRPGETVLHIAGSTIDLRSCSTSLELAEAHSALLAEEEAIALSVWTVSTICGSLRLENVLTMFAGALLEKQIVVVCSNLGILSALVLAIVPLIRPYQWQSLLMPVLPNDMLDFLDAPVPYIVLHPRKPVGVKNRTSEVQAKLANAILIDANKSQVEAAKGFLAVLRSYLDSLCSNLRSHTITNVQSNDDKVSLLLKESFIDSYPSRDRPFMKLFVDTQLFSVHTDLVLSFYQKE